MLKNLKQRADSAINSSVLVISLISEHSSEQFVLHQSSIDFRTFRGSKKKPDKQADKKDVQSKELISHHMLANERMHGSN